MNIFTAQFKRLWIALAITGVCAALLATSLTVGPAKPKPTPSPSPSPLSQTRKPSPLPSPRGDPNPTAVIFGFIVLTLVGIAFYFMPFAIAALRKHPNVGAIFLVNLLLGWICIGWIVALVWSVTAIDQSRTYR